MLQRFSSAINQNRKVILFLTSQSITLFGSSLVQYAIMWHITLSSQSGTVVAIYSVCSFAPQLLVSLFAGVWADRHNRKIIIILADASIALATLVLAIILRGGVESYAPIYIIAAIRSFGSGLQTPAVNAVLPQITEKDKLMRVNSVNGTIQSMVMLVAPAVSGAVLAFGSLPAILMIDVATAIVGISILAFIHIPTLARTSEQQNTGVFKDLFTGLRYARSSFFLRRYSLYYILVSILIVPASMFNVLFVTRVYGDSYFFLTWNEMVFFAGSILGGIALAAWGGFKNRIHTIILGCALFGAAAIFMGLAPQFIIYLFVMFAAGLTTPAFNTPIMVLLQEKVEPDMMGRIFSLMQILGMGVLMVATIFFGPLFDRVPIQSAMIVSGILLIALGGLMLLDKRALHEGLPPTKLAQSEEPVSSDYPTM